MPRIIKPSGDHWRDVSNEEAARMLHRKQITKVPCTGGRVYRLAENAGVSHHGTQISDGQSVGSVIGMSQVYTQRSGRLGFKFKELKDAEFFGGCVVFLQEDKQVWHLYEQKFLKVRQPAAQAKAFAASAFSGAFAGGT